MPGVELATGYVTIVPDTSRVARDMNRAFGQAGNSAGQQGGEAAGSGIGDALGKAGGKGGVIGAALGAAFALAGVSVAGQFAKAFMGALEKEKTLDLAQARLGVDEATAKKIGTAAGGAYAQAFGESVAENIDTARMAMQAGLIDPSATAQDIQQVISQLTGLNDFMAGDLTETTKAAGNLVRTGLVENTQGAFDVLAAGYRAVGLQGDDLIDSVKEYSSGWKNTGLDAQQAMALIAQSINEFGVDSTDRGADALREFGRRVTEEGETIVEALNEIGLNGEEMYDAFKRGGPDAFAAFDLAFDTIRDIPDVAERNAAAMALLGDTAGDFIGGFTQWDPSEAVNKFGTVAGAAQGVIDTMGGNASTSIEMAKRSWTLAMDEVGGAFAQAFGPHLAKLADWVTQHQPEILGFLGKATDAAFAIGDAFLWFSAESLRALGSFAEAAIPTISQTIDPLGKVAELIGRVSGNSDLADFGKSMQDLDDKFQGVADGAYSMADAIDERARPGLAHFRESVVGSITEAQQAQQVVRALGEQVATLPDGHTITITENSPEVVAALGRIGIGVQNIPNSKEFKLVANTADGQAALDSFVARNTGRQVPITLMADWSKVQAGIDNPQLRAGAQPFSPESGYVHYADGGITKAGQASIANRPVNQWAEDGPEAYIPLSPDKRGRSIGIWMEAGRHLGMIESFANGGIAGQRALSWAQGKNGLPYIYGPQDCSWYQSGIYNQLTGKNIRFTTASDLAAFGFKRGSDPYGFTIGTNGGIGEGGHMVGRILGVNVESDGSNGVQFGGTADGPESMPQQWYLPRDLWVPPATDDTSLGTGGGGLPGTGGASSGAPGGAQGAGGAAGGGVGGNASGGTYGGQDVPAGVTPVWIIGGALSTATAAAQPAETTPTSTESFAPQAETKAAEMPDVNARLQGMAGDFAKSNFDQFVGDLGFRTSGGAIQALVQAVHDGTVHQIATALKQQQRRQETVVAQYGFGPR